MRNLAVAAALMLAASPAVAALSPGSKAPDFTTRGAMAGKVSTIHLADQLKKGPVVLYFFPAAFTSGCSAEARAFAEKIGAFKAAGATVIGMSADPIEPLVKFSSADCAGKFTVASAGPAVVAGYDVALGRKMAGREITKRTSYVIGRDGRIVFVHDDMNPAEHVALTLAAVQKLRAR
ncbi:peroxiredoxin [Sphingomonas sp. Leaf17]|uniref:peroxiredoxin n=1 Tax=Sphingomonas sp. Leaf17 TaxID=1735683 RepID=UPI0006FDFD44|nr:peroxiredoxin [Sphingomonas sp. Leaf17]KQM64394.1 peroxiredoxin [Sphingomonas sp. Leaf17]